jgi:cysteinyl-tRNA synthetase
MNFKMDTLHIFNTLSRNKEKFEPIHPNHVGMYVCGPTVYGDPHLGHARSAITFDVVYRYLTFLGYKVRYIRNITDVGHLENDTDEGEDKIVKKAKIEQLEPMEIAQHYINRYHQFMDMLNVKKPSIEPRATGHIHEQIELIEKIIQKGFAYVVNGSVYFDVLKYNEKYPYGILSGRNINDLYSNTRNLEGQSEKRNPLDFALWKNASKEHIMKWKSPWGYGFPGWHIECSAMSEKYLGSFFDIHGGGMDLIFPHHECEIAQATSCCDKIPAKYWMHNNMITIEGKKMGKSYGNFITLEEFFTGNHPYLEQAYSPMTIRYYILQAQYRSTLDISNAALKASSIAYKKLLNTYLSIPKLEWKQQETVNEQMETEVKKYINHLYTSINDDFNTGATLSAMFGIAGYINSFITNQRNHHQLNFATFQELCSTFKLFFTEILGLKAESFEDSKTLIDLLLQIYKQAKENKDYEKVDQIRSGLKSVGIVVKDFKDKIDWAYDF